MVLATPYRVDATKYMKCTRSGHMGKHTPTCVCCRIPSPANQTNKVPAVSGNRSHPLGVLTALKRPADRRNELRVNWAGIRNWYSAESNR